MTDPIPATSAAPDALLAGRDALARHAWQDAYDRLREADAGQGLSGRDLEALAQTAFFTARADEAIGLKERAFKAHQASADPVRAAYVAADLAHEYGFKGQTSIAAAWGHRAEQLLEGREESYAHGYLALLRSDAAKAAGDIDKAMEFAQSGIDIASRAVDPDLRASGLTALGTIKIATGDTSNGLVLMEEAAIAAVNGELSPFTTGVTCCTMIAACRDLTDYRRASEWTEATERYCERQSVSAFPGICRVHRAEVVAVRGAWERAERELEQATTELAGFNAIPPMADGYYALGEIRRMKGDLEGAETALRQAHALGRTPQPALALIRLSQGRVGAAVSGLRTALDGTAWDRWARARLLVAQVEVALASAHHDQAREAVEELGVIVGGYPSPALVAGHHQALGRVLQAEGDTTGSIREFRAAIARWREVSAPYEVARARAHLANALLVIGDDDDADLELQAAHDEFKRLGARLDLETVEHEQRAVADRRQGPSQIRKTFMFTDIVGSTRLAEALGNVAWERLLSWHDGVLRGLIAAQGGEIVHSTGDGFFAAFDTAGAAIACARTIQQSLAEARQGSGFSLSVRIGLHTAEASRRSGDYSGIAVHTAARVAGLANDGEILATSETLAEAGEVAGGGTRHETLKGLTAPVLVSAVTWR